MAICIATYDIVNLATYDIVNLATYFKVLRFVDLVCDSIRQYLQCHCLTTLPPWDV